MPCSAAAQAASGTSVASANSAAPVQADRQTVGGESELLLPAPVAKDSKTLLACTASMLHLQ